MKGYSAILTNRISESGRDDLLKEWNLRTHEDKLLFKYYTQVRGVLALEVPVGTQKAFPPKSKIRRIDGIRIPCNNHLTAFYGDISDEFPGLIKNMKIELIEVKVKLNRLVIGQIIAGVDMFEREYKHTDITPVIVCSEGDPALEWVCENRGIRVVLL